MFHQESLSYAKRLTKFTTEMNQLVEADRLAQSANATEEERAKNKEFVASFEELDKETNTTKKQDLEEEKLSLDSLKAKVDKEGDYVKDIESTNTNLWTWTNSLFVIGGMVGAFTSKFVLEFFGRKKGLLFHYIFSTLGSLAALVAPQFSGAHAAIGLVMFSRLLFGVQGGMMCGLVPTYLNEVAPAALRGSCGVINQLFITIGICFSQVLGFRQLLGTKDLWEYILAFPLVPSLVGGFVLLFFFSETPKALLITNKVQILMLF